MENLKEEILQYLNLNGLKPYQLAEQASINPSIMYRYLNNERGLLLKTAERIRKAMNEGKAN